MLILIIIAKHQQEAKFTLSNFASKINLKKLTAPKRASEDNALEYITAKGYMFNIGTNKSRLEIFSKRDYVKNEEKDVKNN